MSRAIITLTTDFGLSDHFVGVMKGVILGINPLARIVDLTHGIEPFEVNQCAFTLLQAYRYFPKKTIHVSVVDPGVGSARRPILMEAAGQFFVGPDNGLFSMIAAREKHKVRTITAEKYFLHPVSRTFHGRDVFAPVAAHLSKGVTPASFGKPIDDYLRLTATEPMRTDKRTWTGAIMHIDRFGNLVSNFHIDDFPQVKTQPIRMSVGTEQIQRLALNYAECEPGEPFVIVGSSGYLEVAVNQESAAKMLGCGVGAPMELTIF